MKYETCWIDVYFSDWPISPISWNLQSIVNDFLDWDETVAHMTIDLNLNKTRNYFVTKLEAVFHGVLTFTWAATAYQDSIIKPYFRVSRDGNQIKIIIGNQKPNKSYF